MSSNFQNYTWSNILKKKYNYFKIKKKKQLGVEFYESIGDQKFLYFKKKMNQLMMRSNVIEAINAKKDVFYKLKKQTKIHNSLKKPEK